MLAAFAALLISTTPAALTPLDALAPQLDPKVLSLALRAYERAQAQGHARKPVLAVIDYSKPSTEKRLWVFDLRERQLLYHELVAHGRGSGDNVAHRFSNIAGSLASSMGVFVTGHTYIGKHGLSLRLEGLEAGVNDQAGPRAVVIHGAEYVSEAFAQAHGRLGRSFGCPAVSSKVASQLVQRLRDGAVVFSFYPDDRWLKESRFVN